MIPALEAEQAVLEYLAQIRLPTDWRERVLELSQAKRGDTESYETKKTRLENRLERLRTLYKLGDIEKDEYITERADIHKQAGSLEAIASAGNGRCRRCTGTDRVTTQASKTRRA